MSTSKVVIVRGRNLLASGGGDVPQAKVSLLLKRGLQLLTGEGNSGTGIGAIIKRDDRVGIKINTIGGKKLSTRPEVSLALANILTEAGVQAKNMVFWDRTNRELRDAGYTLNMSREGLKVYGTDTEGAGYGTELVSHLNVGSLFSSIQANFVTASISLAMLKDHGMAGVTAGMKNYFGAIHNPNKYHDNNCNPAVAEVFDVGLVKEKHRLTILDCLLVQYHRGPSFHSQWAEPYGGFVFSLDPVAADVVGWRLIEKLRAGKGLPPLKEEGREPLYLATAEKMGHGQANLNNIKIIEEEI
jgi:uncharacterized protein (DUF362 family)